MGWQDTPVLGDQGRCATQKWEGKSRVDVAAEREAADDAKWRACCKVVDLRDGRQCRCCDRKSDPETSGLLKRGHRHHIQYRSAGGPDESWNVVTLCAFCHNSEHVKRTLEIEGNADVALTFKRKDKDTGEWYVTRQETAVLVVLRD